jgi:hypothetical protein
MRYLLTVILTSFFLAGCGEGSEGSSHSSGTISVSEKKEFGSLSECVSYAKQVQGRPDVKEAKDDSSGHGMYTAMIVLHSGETFAQLCYKHTSKTNYSLILTK